MRPLAPYALLSSQRGALFGLDARLALGIFAILAMVAGYMAWWRIDAARELRLYKELTDLEHALEQYQTDLGTFFVFTLNKDPDDVSSREDITALWDTRLLKPGFIASWHGPYLHRQSRHLPGYGELSVLYATGDRKSTCTTDSECFVWLVLEDVPAKQWQAVNNIIDEGGSKSGLHEAPGTDIAAGRLQANGATESRMLFYRTVQRPL